MATDDAQPIRPKTPMYLVVIGVCLVLLSGLIWQNRFLHHLVFGVSHAKVVEVFEQENWPRPLKTLVERADGEGIAVRDVHVCFLNDMLDRYYFWRMDASPEVLALIEEHFDLYAQNGKDLGFAPQGHFPSWWDPPAGKTHPQFRGRADGVGMKGDKFEVLHDTSKQRIYVYYNENW